MLFVLFLESCMPSAQNTVIIHSYVPKARPNVLVIHQHLTDRRRPFPYPNIQSTTHRLEGRPADGTRLARLLLKIYVLSCVPLSILLTLYLQKFGL